MKPRSVLIRYSQEGLEVSVDFLHDGGKVRKAQVQKAAHPYCAKNIAAEQEAS
jgi:hypothetical protein